MMVGEAARAALRTYRGAFAPLFGIAALFQAAQYFIGAALERPVAAAFRAGGMDAELALALGSSVVALLAGFLFSVLQTGLYAPVILAPRGGRVGSALRLLRRLPGLLGIFAIDLAALTLPFAPLAFAYATGKDGSGGPLAGLIAVAGYAVMLMAYLALAFAPVAFAAEGLGFRAALRRSFALSKGGRFRILGLMFLFGLLEAFAAYLLGALLQAAGATELSGPATVVPALALGALLSPLLPCGIVAMHGAARQQAAAAGGPAE